MAVCQTVFVTLERDAAFNQTAPRNVSRLLFLEPDPCVHMVSTWKKINVWRDSQFKFLLSPQNKIKVKTMVNSWIHCLHNKISKIFSKFLFCWNGILKKNSDCRTCTCQNTLPVTPISFSMKRRYSENVYFPTVVRTGMCVNIYFGSSLIYWLFSCLS